MSFKVKRTFLILLFILGNICFCFGQNFDGTNLSSTQPFYSKLPYMFEESENFFIIFNLKYIPSVSENEPPDVKQITIAKMKDNKTKQMRLGTATLEFYSSRYNPLNKIPIMKI